MSDFAERFANLPPAKRKQLLEKLKQRQHKPAKSATVAPPRLEPVERGGPLPLSFAQERLWFLDQFMPNNAFYNVPSVTRIVGHLDAPALEKAFYALVKRHESLRTTFQMQGGRPVQLIAAEPTVTLPIVDLHSVPETVRDQEAHQLIAQETEKHFDLGQGPLMRLLLLRLGQMEHILIITVHHIIYDGWSSGILNQELGTYYSAFSSGQTATLPPLRIQYADFAVWQRNWLQGEVLAKQMDYWKKQLADVPPTLSLPTDYPRPAMQTFRGEALPFVLSKTLTEKLNLLARQENATLFMVLLAALKVLLSFYTGKEDIVLGAPIANRHQAETKALIGLFVNTLALRTDLSGNPTFQELLDRVRNVALNAYAYQDLPFEKLVEELQPERDLSRNPLVQALFAFQNIPAFSGQFSALQEQDIAHENPVARFDLELYMQEFAGGIDSYIIYNTDLFKQATIHRMVNHFCILLESITQHPTKRLAELVILSTDEQQQLLHDWNNTAVAYPPDLCVHNMFESMVARQPEAIAAVFDEQAISYGQLNRQAAQLAHLLRQAGVQPDTLVGVCLERSLTMLVALLAILKAGGAYVPLDPNFPRKRLSKIITDTNVKVILTETQLSQQLALLPENQHILCLDDPATVQLIARQPLTNEAMTTPQHLAYVLHTSGSTGSPKGIQITHQNVTNFLSTMWDKLQVTKDTRLLAVTTISFDIAALELYLPLTVGGTVVIASRETAVDSALLSQAIHDHKINVMQATPVTWQILLRSGWQGEPALQILCGGENLPPDLAQRLLSSGRSLWNLYGPTETTIWSTLHPVQPDDGARTTTPIGRPIANTQIFVLDQYLRPVPVGMPGELYIGGTGVARGYLNRPDLTADQFIPNPFDETTNRGTRLYKTGDIVQYLPSGALEFLGRGDCQVKVRGFRIDLGEIETCLLQLDILEQCVVTVANNLSNDAKLVAYVIPAHKSADQSVLVHAMRQHLHSELPPYMMPSAFVFLDGFPLTPNGKIDRKALPPPEGIQTPARQAYARPTTELEQTLATLWQEVLHLDRVGLHDNFFDLGGHSLLAVQLHQRLIEALPLTISLIDLFAYPTLHTLAAHIQKQNHSKTSRPDVPETQAKSRLNRTSLKRQRQIRQRLRKGEQGD